MVFECRFASQIHIFICFTRHGYVLSEICPLFFKIAKFIKFLKNVVSYIFGEIICTLFATFGPAARFQNLFFHDVTFSSCV